MDAVSEDLSESAIPHLFEVIEQYSLNLTQLVIHDQ